MGYMLPKLLEIIVSVARNPSKPHFNHYMFESLCLCIRIMCRSNPAAVEQFEGALFPLFQGMLQHDVSGKYWILIIISNDRNDVEFLVETSLNIL